MPSSVKEMLAEANAAVSRLNPAEVCDMIGKGNALIVDVRDAPELAAGGKPRRRPCVTRDAGIPHRSGEPSFQKDKTVFV
jgi:rhodanese-related sulfurtransferase